jgi:hypothetical protein
MQRPKDFQSSMDAGGLEVVSRDRQGDAGRDHERGRNELVVALVLGGEVIAVLKVDGEFAEHVPRFELPIPVPDLRHCSAPVQLPNACAGERPRAEAEVGVVLVHVRALDKTDSGIEIPAHDEPFELETIPIAGIVELAAITRGVVRAATGRGPRPIRVDGEVTGEREGSVHAVGRVPGGIRVAH